MFQLLIVVGTSSGWVAKDDGFLFGTFAGIQILIAEFDVSPEICQIFFILETTEETEVCISLVVIIGIVVSKIMLIYIYIIEVTNYCSCSFQLGVINVKGHPLTSSF